MASLLILTCRLIGTWLASASGIIARLRRRKTQLLPPDGLEVFLRHPLASDFFGVSSFHPLSELSIDRVVYVIEHYCADDMAMILRPATNDGIEATGSIFPQESFSCS